MRKYAIFINSGSNNYRLTERSDQSMFTLFMFLGDGLGLDVYMNFLKNKSKKELLANICQMNKKKDLVTVTIYDDVIPDIDSFTTTIENMIIILQEYNHLEDLGVDRIEIVLENNHLSISGDWIN